MTMTPQLTADLDKWAAVLTDEFFESAPFLLQITDKHGFIISVSRLWAGRLGYLPDEMIGRPCEDFMTRDSARQSNHETQPRFQSKGNVIDIEYDYLSKDHKVVPVLLSAIALYDTDGRFLRRVALIFDNTEARETQQALRQKAQEAQDASQAKSRFLAAMSHEIRTPMNAILGFAQLLQMSDLDQPRAEQVAAILRAGRSLMGLLTDLLDLGEAEAGQMRIETAPMPIRDVVDRVSDWWVKAARDKGLRFAVTMEQGLSTCIVSDRTRLEQVLNNLLSNAVKFTESGRIDLIVEESRFNGARARLRFEVRDTGPGMSQAQIARLFQPFVRLGTAPRGDQSGWGLGLSICHQIATAMDAHLSVTSTPGQGSSFVFEVPVALPDETDNTRRCDTPPQQTPAPVPPRPLHILLAEDNQMNANMLMTVLESRGHTVDWVNNGVGAITQSLGEVYDLVIMDIMMPGLDGLSATRQIRIHKPDLPIIVCSAVVAAAEQAQYRDAGMTAFLPKPVDQAQLWSLIEQVTPAAVDEVQD